jgi:hypothetical protein
MKKLILTLSSIAMLKLGFIGTGKIASSVITGNL